MKKKYVCVCVWMLDDCFVSYELMWKVVVSFVGIS